MRTIYTIISFIILVISAIVVRYISFLNISNLCQLDSRPVIYGDEFCREIDLNNITVTSSTFQRTIDLFAHKTIIYAKHNNRDIVLKNLIHPGDFYKIEEEFYNKFSDNFFNSRRVIDIIKIYIHSSLRYQSGSANVPKFQLCPNKCNIENLFKKLNTNKYVVEDFLHLWTIFQSNPEPVMLKLLSPPTWPVPEFFGSCGRIIAVEYCGRILSDYYYASWPERASLAFQLLDSALQFTFQDPVFAYYLTDLSPDNIAVSKLGKLKFIDLENVIVVDRNPFIDEVNHSLHLRTPRRCVYTNSVDGTYITGKRSAIGSGNDMEVWIYNHTTRHVPCNDCIVIDSNEICRHNISDHNVYAVCKEILSESSIFPKGFLHSRAISPGLEDLDSLITDCVVGVEKSRFETATTIMSILKTSYT